MAAQLETTRCAEEIELMNNTKSNKRPILKFFLIACGTITVLVVAIIIWTAVALFSGPDAMELSVYHPFRSPEAKEQYLKLYDIRAKQWPVVSETRMVETSYGQTFIRISGPTNAPTLVLLPGAGSTSLIWMPNIKAWSEVYRTYALDNIYDYGRSVYTRTMEKPGDLVNWLSELFDALALGNDIHLVGLSYGGWLTSQYAIYFPNQLNKIVLIAPAATILPLTSEWAWRAILTLIPHRYFLKSTIYWIFEDLKNKDEYHQILVDEYIDDAYLAIRCFKFKMPVAPTVLGDQELKNIKIPTLYIVGENEKIYSAQEAVQRLNNVAPQIRTKVIPNTGHDITILQAERINREVLEFLER